LIVNVAGYSPKRGALSKQCTSVSSSAGDLPVEIMGLRGKRLGGGLAKHKAVFRQFPKNAFF
jgi:hypothetical protein